MISVIIPVYNAARWLPQCLRSVLAQDYADLEVILVDDASTDRSAAVCRRFAADDSRITIIGKAKNEGVEQARHDGLRAARGEYVMFVDADDWLAHRQVLSRMYEKAEQTGADFVVTGVRRVLDRCGLFARKTVYRHRGLLEGGELRRLCYEEFFKAEHIVSINSMSDKLYRKSFLDKADTQPSGFVYAEDSMFNLRLFPLLNRIFILDDTGYNYRYGGMTSRCNLDVCRDLKRINVMKEQMLRDGSCPHDDRDAEKTRIELKNVLKSEICQRIEFLHESRERIVAYLDAEMKRPLYDRMRQTPPESELWNDPFAAAFADGDAGAMYAQCLAEVRNGREKRAFRRFIARVIRSL